MLERAGSVVNRVRAVTTLPWRQVIDEGRAGLDRLWPGAKARRDMAAWKRAGRPVPPPHALKERVVRDYAQRFGLSTLVETGTYLGEMVTAMADHFEVIYTIELDEHLYEQARQRFARVPHVHVLQGDSAAVLPSVFSLLPGPALFWLDGHYSGGITARGAQDTPIMDEVVSVATRGQERDVLLIDDAVLFTGMEGYPTVEQLHAAVREAHPTWVVAVRDNIIRIHAPLVAPSTSSVPTRSERPPSLWAKN